MPLFLNYVPGNETLTSCHLTLNYKWNRTLNDLFWTSGFEEACHFAKDFQSPKYLCMAWMRNECLNTWEFLVSWLDFSNSQVPLPFVSCSTRWNGPLTYSWCKEILWSIGIRRSRNVFCSHTFDCSGFLFPLLMARNERTGFDGG